MGGWTLARWLRLVLGAGCVLVGAFLTLKPFYSLGVLLLLVVGGLAVTGAAGLLEWRLARSRWGWIPGALYLLAALAVISWPGLTIQVVARIVGSNMVIEGVLEAASARRARGRFRSDVLLGGLAAVVFGVLALVWPDVSVLVIAILFGTRLLMVGLRQVLSVVRLPSRGTIVGAALAVTLAGISVIVRHAVPVPDAFYEPPASVPAEPGRLVRSEPFTSPELPSGAIAWRILYTTTRDQGQPALSSGLVIAPASAATAPSPVLAWAHGTTGVARGCAPSVLPGGLGSGAMYVQDRIIAAGWTLVATDYVGLGTGGQHPYLIGQSEGRSVLDAVRAARQLGGVRLANDTVVWGHSQGGHAALWAGILAPSYAPELTIAGVAALAPATNLPDLIDNLSVVPGGALFAGYVFGAYVNTYPDVTYAEFLRPGGDILIREMSERCLAEPGVLLTVVTTLLLDKPAWQDNPNRGAFRQRLTENIPSGPIRAPLLIAQGTADALVLPVAQDAYVQARCAAGYAVDYRRYPGRDHGPLAERDSPAIAEVFTWTTDRFAGEPARDTCR